MSHARPTSDLFALARARLIAFDRADLRDWHRELAGAALDSLARHARRLESAERLRCIAPTDAAAIAAAITARRVALERAT